MTRIWRELKPFAWLAAIVVAYGILRAVYSSAAGSHGVITPALSIDHRLAILAFATLAMRLVVLVVVPFVAIYKLVWRLARLRSRFRP